MVTMAGVEVAIARHAFRRIRFPALAWGAVFGATAAAAALSYASSFPTVASRLQIAATTGRDTGLAVLLGPVAGIGTVGGYTAYKCFAFVTTIGAVWALLTTTRSLRGEEDSGRWQLVLSGPTRPPRATAATILALGCGVVALIATTTVIVLLAGRDSDLAWGPGASLTYGASLAIPPGFFVAVGAVASQLGRTRRVANGVGMAVLALAFVLRMIADTGSQAAWLLWSTPFGWTERVRPFTENDLWPLVPAAAAIAVLCLTAGALAARRDVGEGVLASRDVGASRAIGLRTPLGLAARLEFPALAAWFGGAIAAALALSVIAKIAVGSLPDSVSRLLDNLGAHGSFLDKYLGVAFLLVATIVALIPAATLGAAAAEETSGRLVHVLAGPASRAAVFAGRLGLSALVVTASGVAAGAAMWVGAASQGLPIGFGSTLGAGLNVVPTALVALGVGALVLAVAPRFAAAAGYAVVAGSLILDLVASMVGPAGWVKYGSVFHYLRLAPSQQIDLLNLAITTAAAALLCGVATVTFSRRDVPVGP